MFPNFPTFQEPKSVFSFPSQLGGTPIIDLTQSSIQPNLSLQALNDIAQLKSKIDHFMNIFTGNLVQKTEQYEVCMYENQAKEFEHMCKIVNNSATDRITYQITRMQDGRFKVQFEHRSIPIGVYAKKN